MTVKELIKVLSEFDPDYELPIILMIFMLFPAMIMTAQYMIDKYSPTTSQEQERR